MNIIFETSRLLLREMTEDDAPLIFELNSDPEVLKYLHERPLTSVKNAKEIIRNIILPQYDKNLGRWAVIVKDTNEFIGWCGLKHRRELDEIDLGYRFKQTAWGRGYATEASKHTLNYGFNELQLPVITARAHIKNTSSIKVLEKIGMKYIRNEIIDECPVRTYLLRNENFNE